MRLLACLIVAPQRGYDEPAILSYAISSFCPTSADGLHSRTVFSALSGMRLLACLIVAPQRGYDEPAILSYAISSFYPTSADGLQRAWDRLGEGKFSPSAYRASEPRRT